ncbi:MAG: hypothetical protein ACNYNX_07080 [Leucobacter sp.]
MQLIALVVALALLAALAVLQSLVAAGLPYGRLVWGGAHRVLPRRLRIGSAISVLVYAGFAALLLSRAGVLPGGDSGVVVVLSWLLFAYFALGTVVNALSRSRAERLVMTPSCAVLAVASLVIALG